MGVPMRMRCDNCGYDFVGQLNYSDQRQGDVIRCKACEYEVPMISDEEIADIETMLNKERNFAIYALVAWVVCFLAMVVWGLSYFWQVRQGFGDPKTKDKSEVLWAQESRSALYLRANLSGDDQVQIPNTSILMNVEGDDSAAKAKLDEYNDKLKKMNTALSYIGDSVQETLLTAKFDDHAKMTEKCVLEQKLEQYLGDSPGSPPADWAKAEDPGTKTGYYVMKAGEDVTVKSADPANPQDLKLKLVVGYATRVPAPNTEEKASIASVAELQYTDGDITIAYDPLAKRVVRTEVKRPSMAAAANADTANAVVFGTAVVVPLTLMPSDAGNGNHAPIQIAQLKAAKDTSPSSITFLMLALWIIALLIAIPMTWLACRGRYTMQLGIVEKEPEVEPEAPEDMDGEAAAETGDQGDGAIGDDEDLADTARIEDDIDLT